MDQPVSNPLTKGWTRCSVDDVTLPVSKVDPKSEPERNISYIDISGIDNNRNVILETKSFQLKTAPSRARQIISAGDVLFSTVRPYLRNIAAVPSKYDRQIASTGFSVLRPASGMDARFLFYCCTSPEFVNTVSGKQYGVSYPAVKDEQVREQIISLPPYNEQRRIVAKIEELFSELDKGIENLQTAREQLKVYRQAVLKHAFEGKLTAQWREQNKDKLETADQLLTRIKNERDKCYQQQVAEWNIAAEEWENRHRTSKKPTKPKVPGAIKQPEQSELATLTKLPYGWAWQKVSSLCEVVRGGSPRPAGDKRYYDGDIPFLKVADLTRNGGAYLDTYSYTIKGAGLQKTRRIKPNTLMISNSGATLGVPKICLIDATFNDGIAAFLGLRASHLVYHYYFWLSRTATLRAINQGAAQPNLNTDLLKGMLISLCAPPEMYVVAQQVQRLLSICERIAQEIEDGLLRCDSLRQSILKKAFSGQLVAQDADDEPASVLLERIRAEKVAQAKPGRKHRKTTRKPLDGVQSSNA